jgi:hypothetical protein
MISTRGMDLVLKMEKPVKYRQGTVQSNKMVFRV